MADAYLGLGSNLGNRKQLLEQAISALNTLAQTRVAARSQVYETLPVGPQDQNPFLNMVVQIQTGLAPLTLLSELQAIERKLGRAALQDRQRWGPREIDIDLLLYGNDVIDTPSLTVPHPELHQRWFVLKPLTDLAPRLAHPILGVTIAELLAQLPDEANQAHGSAQTPASHRSEVTA